MKQLTGPLSRIASVLSLLACLVPAQAALVTIPAGGLTGTHNWTADNEYLLDGWVYVLDGAVLNIEAGTVIRGKEAASAPNYGALYVCRGSKINALGTRLKPIIFTAEDDDIADPFDIPLNATVGQGRGRWGGVILLGRGRINRVDGAASGSGSNPDSSLYQLYEGLGDDEVGGNKVHRFGGNDDNDNSGCLRFVSIRYSGKALSADKELNGLSMAAIGRGTTIEFVEVYAGADDAFEWWGGAVNTRYLVASYCDDEMFDMDQGHMGKHQFLFGLQAIAGDEGMELNGQPTGGAGNAQVAGLTPLGAHQIYNVTLIGEGGAGNDSDVMNTRASYYGQVHNSVFTQFRGKDVVSSVAPNNGFVSHNLFWDNAGDRGIVGLGTNAPAAGNPEADPLLVGIDREQDQLLDPRPAVGSPVFSGYKETPENGHFYPAPYKGAFSATDNWLLGWTALYQNEHLKKKAASPVPVVIPAGGLSGTHTWTAANEYLLDGWVYVLDGAVLNIEAGTVIRGKEAASAPNYGALYVCRGGKINAVGSTANPIIFTAESDKIEDPFDIPLNAVVGEGRGRWGGVILLGRGRINRVDGAASGSGTNPDSSLYQLYEGLGDNEVGGNKVHRFGGNDDNDSSGALKYVSIRYSGKALSADKELNGLSLAGVGRGTTLECVEVYAGADDAFEWWGGAVNSRYLVASYCDDEMFDMDQGHMGKHQFLFGLQAIAGDEGMELNGQPTGGSGNGQVGGLTPLGRHEIYNVTLIGEGGAGNDSDVMNTRATYYGQVHNSVFTQFRGKDVVSSVATNYGSISHNLFWDNAGDRGIVGGTNAPAATNPEADPLLVGIDRQQGRLLDPRPAAGSPVYTGWRTPPVNGTFEQTAFKGAFDKELWCADWTALTDNEHLVPTWRTAKCLLPSPQPSVTMGAAGTQATLIWEAISGATYQVQHSTDLATWQNEGSLQTAGGEGTATLTHVSTLGGAGAKKHFRVIAR